MTFAFIAVTLIMLARILTLGSFPLLDPTESRYAEIAREMVETGDWVMPHLSGEPFWGKPPLSFWMTALSYQVFGMNEFASRFPSWLLGSLMIVLVFCLASNLGGRAFGAFCSLILASTGLFYVLAGLVMTDSSLSACVTLSMVGFALAFRSRTELARVFWGYAFFVGIGAGLLAKGLVGLVLTFLPIVVWIVWKRRWRQVARGLPWKSGLLLALAIGVPWHLLAEMETPGFLHYYFIGEHFKRFLVSSWDGNLYGKSHDHPLGTIWAFFVAGSLPWGILLVSAVLWLRRNGKPFSLSGIDEWTAYLLLWMLTPMVFFTAARNILMPYVLPAMPPLAILTGLSLQAVLRIAESSRPRFVNSWAVALCAAFVPIAFSIASFTLLEYMGSRNSQKELIATFEKAAGTPDTNILYVSKWPYSAQFYSAGRARHTEANADDSVSAELSDDSLDFFAIYIRDLDKFPPDAWGQTEEVGRFGKFILRRELDHRDVSPRVEILRK